MTILKAVKESAHEGRSRFDGYIRLGAAVLRDLVVATPYGIPGKQLVLFRMDGELIQACGELITEQLPLLDATVCGLLLARDAVRDFSYLRSWGDVEKSLAGALTQLLVQNKSKLDPLVVRAIDEYSIGSRRVVFKNANLEIIEPANILGWSHYRGT